MDVDFSDLLMIDFSKVSIVAQNQILSEIRDLLQLILQELQNG